MRRGLARVSWFVFMAVLVGGPALSGYALATDALIAQACDPAATANVRSAAADAVSARWLQEAPDAATLFQYVNDPSVPAECRRMGFEAQLFAIFSEGAPEFGAALTGDTAQVYADAVAGAATPEYAYLLATAVARFARNGFAIVPGGLAESLNRLQTCLDGAIQTNQDNLVVGIALDCGVEAVRRAIGDTIATSFYVFFRTNPAVNLSCDDLRAQAEDASATAEARWAAAKAFVFDGKCTANTVEALSALATSGGSVELRQAAVAPLAQLLAEGNSARTLLFNASNASTAELRQAYGWGAGLALIGELDVTPACKPTTEPTGLLELWASVRVNGQSEPALAAIAPLARFNLSELDDANAGISCGITVSSSELRVTISRAVSGTTIPLQTFILL